MTDSKSASNGRKRSASPTEDGANKAPKPDPSNGDTDTPYDHPNLRHPSRKRAKEIDAHPPARELSSLLEKTSSSEKSNCGEKKNVLHWFRSKDLRAGDNKGLHAAGLKVKETSGALIACYLHCPADLEWHGTSAVRTDFMLESLRLLQKKLEGDLNVPLVVLEVGDRNGKTDKIWEFVKDNEIGHVFANWEYEVDEIRRDIDMAKKIQESQEVSFELLHDQTVVEPGELKGSGGGPIKVFTPYHKAWLQETKANDELLQTVPAPDGNSTKTAESVKKLLGSKIPSLPKDKQLKSDEHRDKLRKMWPPGQEAGMKRLQNFLEKTVSKYADQRSEPAADVSSRMSPYFAAGIVSVREVLKKTREWNNGAHFDAGDAGVDSWAREICFREFYRHTAVDKPHGSMNMPQNVKFDAVEWEDDEEGWQKWCKGMLGVPWVDAGMRQLNAEGYMANRLRMAVSSYLRGNLLLDYRKGERYFVEHLVDWDLYNNTNGWEPSHTFFNPISQAEKCDPKGEYIRRWVPELANVEGKAIFAPFDRLSKEEFQKLGYPEPHVNFEETAVRARERYKQAFRDANEE